MSYERETSAGYLTNWAARLFARSLERRIGTGSGPMPVFFALQDGSTMTQKELVQVAAVEQPTMANTLNRMERDGLIVRTPDPDDRRSARIALTPLGLERAEAAFRAAVEVNDIATSALRPEERPAFHDMLRRVVSALERDGEPD
ncbi:MarR family transcriptional regulator [Devosia sp. ZB163]|uniref:MarR family winged helix-turn-helix transcriptional regulator n=1 Tax=Devosia sp. ZB163 TaxID=3025938 RepID=UPI00235EE5F5|nr:MarR family transcriptional regulator [Devosia sp. ZB163]MDC9824027.1 MarR family transcriptional regulator [Devosia sp. ZB163]